MPCGATDTGSIKETPLYMYTHRVVRVATMRTTRFFVDKADNACKKEPRRGDRIQAGVKPLLSIRKKKKPQRGDGTAAYPLSFRHSFGVLMGDAFIQGLRYRLPLPKVCRPFGAYNPHNLIPNSRSDGGGTFISGRASCGIHHLPVFCRTYSALLRRTLYTQRVALG